MLDIDSIQHRFDTFHSLMASRIRNILLVSSVYDAYILEEDGTLEERIWQQYADRGLSTVPSIRKVSGLEHALNVIRSDRIELVLAIVHDETESISDLAPKVKEINADLPVAILATDPSTLQQLSDPLKYKGADRIFLWQNDPTLLVAIIKYFEDLANVDHDTRAGAVRVQEMHRLNLQYRGIDRTTDVLSFALQEADEPLVVAELGQHAYPLILGDVILSTETTQKQAEEHRHSFEKELDVLLIHGILHLLGYDHQIDEDALIMEELERKITNALDIDRR